MLRFDHSKKILYGILGDHSLKDKDGNLSLNLKKEIEYGISSVSFPKPSAKQTLSLDFEENTNSNTQYTGKVSLNEDILSTLDHKHKMIVIWDGFEYECVCYMNSQNRVALKKDTDLSKQTYYLGNGSLGEHYNSIEEYDVRVPFFAEIINGQINFTTNKIDVETHSVEIHSFFEIKIYMGLSITEPNYNGENFREPGPEEDSLWEEYRRVRLNTNSSFDKTLPLLSSAAIDAEGKAEVHNNDMILFPEAVGDAATGWGKVTHFGLFYGDEKSERPEDQTPFLWGEILDKDGNVGVNIGRYEVPVIRKDSLQISLQ